MTIFWGISATPMQGSLKIILCQGRRTSKGKNKPKRNKDGLDWRRFKCIAHDELEKCMLNFEDAQTVKPIEIKPIEIIKGKKFLK